MDSLKRERDFLVGIDSDGCAFDTMELKHKECFIPRIIQYYGLQGVSKYAREVAEFVNLYSQMRGINRFPGLVETLRLLARRPEVKQRGVVIEVPASLARWCEEEPRLGNPALKRRVDETADPHLERALAWSEAVNRTVDEMVHGVPPFPFVRESLQRLQPQADLLVVSATPQAALQKEWTEHSLVGMVRAICGQESGTKKEVLKLAAGYPSNHALMIGDAPGDYQAAKANQCLFFPICPGQEERSWRNFCDEGLDRFFAGTFAGDYQQRLLDEFNSYLPAEPPWPLDAA